jgi:hypothetical protein
LKKREGKARGTSKNHLFVGSFLVVMAQAIAEAERIGQTYVIDHWYEACSCRDVSNPIAGKARDRTRARKRIKLGLDIAYGQC